MATQLSNAPAAPPAAISRVLARFDRDQLAGFITVAIDLLDLTEDDADAELNGDEEDNDRAEDDFINHLGDGPGCPVSDGNGSTGRGAGDPSWTEWHTRGRHKLGRDGEEQCRTIGIPNMAHEDAEEDDPREDDDPDEQDDDDAANCGEDRGTKAGGAPGLDGAVLEGAEGESGLCSHYGMNQEFGTSEGEAFHTLNDIPLIRVPLPENDQ